MAIIRISLASLAPFPPSRARRDWSVSLPAVALCERGCVKILKICVDLLIDYFSGDAIASAGIFIMVSNSKSVCSSLGHFKSILTAFGGV